MLARYAASGALVALLAGGLADAFAAGHSLRLNGAGAGDIDRSRSAASWATSRSCTTTPATAGADLCVVRSGVWYVNMKLDGTAQAIFSYGVGTDVPFAWKE